MGVCSCCSRQIKGSRSSVSPLSDPRFVDTFLVASSLVEFFRLSPPAPGQFHVSEHGWRRALDQKYKSQPWTLRYGRFMRSESPVTVLLNGVLNPHLETEYTCQAVTQCHSGMSPLIRSAGRSGAMEHDGE